MCVPETKKYMQIHVSHLRINKTTVCAAMLRFSPRLSTFSWVLAFRFTTVGSACRSSHRLARMASLWGLSLGLCRIKVASKFPTTYPASCIRLTCESGPVFPCYMLARRMQIILNAMLGMEILHQIGRGLGRTALPLLSWIHRTCTPSTSGRCPGRFVQCREDPELPELHPLRNGIVHLLSAHKIHNFFFRNCISWIFHEAVNPKMRATHRVEPRETEVRQFSTSPELVQPRQKLRNWYQTHKPATTLVLIASEIRSDFRTIGMGFTAPVVRNVHTSDD